LPEKFAAFGWETVAIDGHDSAAIFDVVTARKRQKPFMVVAKTTKGKGISYMENVPVWHYRSPSPKEYEQGVMELEKAAS
jgi:transketolase